MDRGGRLIGVLIIILLIISGLWAFNYFYGLKPTPAAIATQSFLQTAMGSKVLIVDMNADERPLLSEVFSGDDAVLVVHQGDDPNNHENDTDYANDILLSMFDQNKDGRIDANDSSIYKRLELKYFDKSKNGFFGYTPINQAGIRAIYIDPKYYSKFGSADIFPRPIGTAIMADGTARLIRQIVVDKTYLRPEQQAPVTSAPVAPTPAPTP